MLGARRGSCCHYCLTVVLVLLHCLGQECQSAQLPRLVGGRPVQEISMKELDMLLSGSQQKLAAVPVQRTLHYSFQGDRLHKNCFAIRKARGRGWNWCTSETNGTAANCTLIDEMFQAIYWNCRLDNETAANAWATGEIRKHDLVAVPREPADLRLPQSWVVPPIRADGGTAGTKGAGTPDQDEDEDEYLDEETEEGEGAGTAGVLPSNGQGHGSGSQSKVGMGGEGSGMAGAEEPQAVAEAERAGSEGVGAEGSAGAEEAGRAEAMGDTATSLEEPEQQGHPSSHNTGSAGAPPGPEPGPGTGTQAEPPAVESTNAFGLIQPAVLLVHSPSCPHSRAARQLFNCLPPLFPQVSFVELDASRPRAQLRHTHPFTHTPELFIIKGKMWRVAPVSLLMDTVMEIVANATEMAPAVNASMARTCFKDPDRCGWACNRWDGRVTREELAVVDDWRLMGAAIAALVVHAAVILSSSVARGRRAARAAAMQAQEAQQPQQPQQAAAQLPEQAQARPVEAGEGGGPAARDGIRREGVEGERDGQAIGAGGGAESRG